MNTEGLVIETDGAVRIVTLDRPERLNALSGPMINGLAAMLDDTELDDSVRVLLICGSPRADGRGCFSAGADLKDLAQGGAAAVGEREFDLVREVTGLTNGDHLGMAGIRHVFSRLETFPMPVIAAIDGTCTAGGIELALSCDLRIVADTAQISDLHLTNVFHTGGAGATSRLSRLIGASYAKEMIFLGRVLDGHEAFSVGFANAVVPAADLLATARRMAAEIATRNPIALRVAKALADSAQDMSRDASLRYDYLCWTAQMMTTGAYAGAEVFARGSEPPPAS
jgi:enoyl-CoA hydratase/carnithine racemase